MSVLSWDSDGVSAALALVLYGIVLFVILLGPVRRNAVIFRLLPAAVLWHLVVLGFTSLWMLPYYSAETGADSKGYHDGAMLVAGYIRTGDWGRINWGWNTEAIPIITGFLYTPFGGDVYGMLFLSAVVGLCGCLYFCLAFARWAGPTQAKTYSRVVLFLPSFALWTGIFGKDSWVALGLGLSAYGYSSILKTKAGLGYLLVGLLITTIVRPHVALVLAVGGVISYLRGLTKNRRSSLPAKIQNVALLVATMALLAWVSQSFLGLSDVSAESLTEYGQAKSAGNSGGGSSVEIRSGGGVKGALLGFPRGVVRILFQPFPWEVHNLNTGLAAGENLFLLWFTLSHLPRLRKLFRELVREPYVLFASIIAVGLLMMFSLLPNLGLLSRERAQLLPFVFAPLVASEAIRKRREPLGAVPQFAGNGFNRRPISPQPVMRSS